MFREIVEFLYERIKSRLQGFIEEIFGGPVNA